MRKIDRIKFILKQFLDANPEINRIEAVLSFGGVESLYIDKHSIYNFPKYSTTWLALYGLETILRETDLYTFQGKTSVVVENTA